MNEPNSGLSRREMRATLEALYKVVKLGTKQNRHVRRNNLRVARAEAKAAARV